MHEIFSPPLDNGIEQEVKILNKAGVETFESCQGGNGHAYPKPTIRFHGDRSEGFRVLAIAMQNGFQIESISRIWPILDGEPTGPWWEMTLSSTKAL